MFFMKCPVFLFLSIILISGSCNGIPKLTTENFFLGTEQVTRDQAVDLCRDRSMELVSIQDSVKNKAIYELLKENDVGYAVWTSAKKGAVESSWNWLNGDEIKYFNWGPGEPNGARGNEDCIEVFKKNTDVLWNDQPCEDKRAYVCEKPQSECNITLISVTVDNKECSLSTDAPTKTTKKFYLSNQKASRAYALKQCSDMFMQLARLRDEDENNALYELMRETKSPYWTAGNRKAGRKWEWLNDEPITYFNWAKGEPNSKDNVGMCLEVFISENSLVWNDHYCSNERYFVCEKIDPVVEITVDGELTIPQDSVNSENSCNVIIKTV